MGRWLKICAVIFAIAVTAAAAGKAMHLGSLIYPDLLSPKFVPYKVEVQQQSRRSQQMDGTIAFFGDSITVGLATSNVSFKSENFGINGDTIEGLLDRVPKYNLSGARMIVVEIGINDWSKNRFTGFGEKYKKLLQLFPESVPIIATAIMPVNSHSTSYPVMADARPGILQANEEIAAVCKQRANCHFLDITSALSDRSGDLVSHFDVGDGVHLSSDGYQVWTQSLIPLTQTNSH